MEAETWEGGGESNGRCSGGITLRLPTRDAPVPAGVNRPFRARPGQRVPQEFLTRQNPRPRSSPYPTNSTAWSAPRAPARLGPPDRLTPGTTFDGGNHARMTDHGGRLGGERIR